MPDMPEKPMKKPAAAGNKKRPAPNAQKKKKQAAPSPLKQILTAVAAVVLLFGIVSGITFAALAIKHGGFRKQSETTEQSSASGLEEIFEQQGKLPVNNAGISETMPTGSADAWDDWEEMTRTRKTTDSADVTTATTTVSVQTQAPPVQQYANFYTYPEQQQTETELPGETTETEPSQTQPILTDPADAALYDSYAEVLRQFISSGAVSPRYSLPDLNGDGAPELLIVSGGDEDAERQIFTFADGRVCALQNESGEAWGELFTSEDTGWLAEICVSEGVCETYYYEFDGQALKLLHVIREVTGAEESCYLDGEPVSAEEIAQIKSSPTDWTLGGQDYILPETPEALTTVGERPVAAP